MGALRDEANRDANVNGGTGVHQEYRGVQSLERGPDSGNSDGNLSML